MDGFANRRSPWARSSSRSPHRQGSELELVDAELVWSVGAVASAGALSPSPPPAAPELEARSLFGEAERIAARAASASRRRQYGAIFRAFGDWLAGELHRPPVVGDLDADVIAAYARHLARSGGRGETQRRRRRCGCICR